MNIQRSLLAIPLLFVIGCGESAKEKPAAATPPPAASTVAKVPTLISMSPPETVAGVKFNAQPDGSAALGVSVKDASSAAVIVFGTKVLDSVHGPGVMSALVPADLFSKPGTFPVFIRDSNGDSNKLDFIVKPK